MEEAIRRRIKEADRLITKNIRALADLLRDGDPDDEWAELALITERLIQSRAEMSYLLASKLSVYGV